MMRASLPRPLCLGLFALFSVILCGFNAPAMAQTGGIALANFSFEAPVVSSYDEVKSGYAMTQAGTASGWTFSDYAGIGLAGFFNKDASGFGQVAPDGNQVGYVQSYYAYPPARSRRRSRASSRARTTT